ncbi:MAG: ribonuclease HII [candidate division Zixibacteria bacterium]|nr:ribonuclease HII [candidate division Zixibacteria bacterium]
MRRGNLKPKIVCGVDEVGRGPLAGPVVAAAVVLDSKITIEGLADSKLLSPAQRYRIFSEIMEKSAGFAIAGVSRSIIDKINILQASFLAMKRAIEKLPVRPDKVYVDGNFEIPDLNISQKAIVDGDKLIPQISAASILAKVARDAFMTELANKYPEYGFERHKGYPTKEHIEIIKRLGPCEIHRRSFRPVSQMALWTEN